jgi:Flp pilus assembly protein TadG
MAPPFFQLILAIIELGLTLLTQSVLNGATRDAARMVRTGQIAAAGNFNQQVTLFQTTLCNNLSALLIQATCDNNVSSTSSVQRFQRRFLSSTARLAPSTGDAGHRAD